MGEQERKPERTAIDVLADLVGELEQQSTQTSRDGLCERDATGILKREAVFLADAFDGAQLCGGERLSRDLVDSVGEHSVEAKHGARSGDADNHLSSTDAAGGQL